LSATASAASSNSSKVAVGPSTGGGKGGGGEGVAEPDGNGRSGLDSEGEGREPEDEGRGPADEGAAEGTASPDKWKISCHIGSACRSVMKSASIPRIAFQLAGLRGIPAQKAIVSGPQSPVRLVVLSNHPTFMASVLAVARAAGATTAASTKSTRAPAETPIK
jgi:hypothetical protein